MEYLIAFDPGGTTGWCGFRRPFAEAWFVYDFGQFPVEHLSTIVELVPPDATVLYEQIHMLHMGFDPIGLEVIGAIKLWCQLEGNKLVSQSPGVLTGAKVWPELNDARKWFKRQQHARDAFYHGVTRLGLKNVDLTKRPQCTS